MPCPRCGTPAAFSPQNKWRPFCGERCRMVDLGLWASESYRVPVEGGAADEQPAADDEGKA